jgi:pectate lyase
MTFDLESFEFGTLVIDGTLRIDGNYDEITITANNIWVRAGSLFVGTKDNDYARGKINIILKGTR